MQVRAGLGWPVEFATSFFKEKAIQTFFELAHVILDF